MNDLYLLDEVLNYLNENLDIENFDNSHKKKNGKLFKYIDINSESARKYFDQDSECKRNADYIKNNRCGEIAVCIDDDKLAGYIFVYNKGKNKGYIQPLYIFKEYRGYGISKILVNDSINKYGAIDLSVEKANKVAIELYKKCGFVIVCEDKYNKESYSGLWYMKLKSKLTDEEKKYIKMNKF